MKNPHHSIPAFFTPDALLSTLEVKKQAFAQIINLENSLVKFAAYLFEDGEQNQKNSFKENNFRKFLETCRENHSHLKAVQDPQREHLVLSQIMMLTGLSEESASMIHPLLKRKFEADDLHAVVVKNSNEMSRQAGIYDFADPVTQKVSKTKIKRCRQNVLDAASDIQKISVPLLRITDPEFHKKNQRSLDADAFSFPSPALPKNAELQQPQATKGK